MLYLSSTIDEKKVEKIVFAQDTGVAIKGAVRADMFLGFGTGARESAGKLKSPLKLWILLPKEKKINE
jgi:membrane-bound lytic murein transglycosylase A